MEINGEQLNRSEGDLVEMIFNYLLYQVRHGKGDIGEELGVNDEVVCALGELMEKVGIPIKV